MQPSKSYTRQAAIVITLLVSVIAFLSYFALQHIKRSTLNSVQASLQTILETVDETHHLLLEQRLSSIENIAEVKEVVNLTEQLLQDYKQHKSLTQSDAQTRLRDFITPILAKYGDQGFFIIAPDKVSIGSMRNSNVGFTNLIAQHKHALFARSLKGETVFVPPMKSDVPLSNENIPSYLQQTMFVMTPIRNASNQVIAVFTLRINPQVYFNKITTLGQVGQTGETYAFNHNGIVLTSSRFSKQLIMLNNRRLNPNGPIVLKDPGGDLTQGFVPALPYEQLPLTTMAQQALHGIDGSNMKGYRDYRGVEVFGGSAQSETIKRLQYLFLISIFSNSTTTYMGILSAIAALNRLASF